MPYSSSSQKSRSLLPSLYFSNMVKWISPKLLTVFLTTWLQYFLKIVGWVGWVGWVGLPAWVSRPERPKGAKDEVGAWRAPRLPLLNIMKSVFPGRILCVLTPNASGVYFYFPIFCTIIWPRFVCTFWDIQLFSPEIGNYPATGSSQWSVFTQVLHDNTVSATAPCLVNLPSDPPKVFAGNL